MPFTVSHIAAVLPAHRLLSRARVFSAAVIGSMVPDFGLLLPIFPSRVDTHSLLGLCTFCLPVGLAAYWLTMLLIKPAILEILPDGAYSRVREADAAPSGSRLRHWLTASLAILLGAITHLAWDAFTHEHSSGVRMFPVLRDYGLEVEGHTLLLYAWLQYASSLAGLVAVIAALILWLRHVPRPPRYPVRRLRAVERRSWGGLYLGAPLLAMLATLWMGRSAALIPLGVWLERLAETGMRLSIVSLLFVSVLLRARLAAASHR